MTTPTTRPAPRTIPATEIATLQKVCDIHDWFDPALDHIVRRVLRAAPGGRRRSWEFAMIYLALHRAGALRPEARGLGMGVGRERLIYALAEAVGHVTSTDLFAPDSQWVAVRVADPQGVIEQGAPWPIPAGRITAEAADMRDLPYPDESFDFAWSTGSFEHIGEDADFLRHLNETARVLKPGGVYAFTSEIAFAPETYRIPGCHCFTPGHFVALLHASALTPEPVFDLAVRPHLSNRPIPRTLSTFGLAGLDAQILPVVNIASGKIMTAIMAVLRKTGVRAAAPPRIVGFEETSAWMRREAEMVLRRLWRDWQGVTLTPGRDGWASTPALDLPPGPIEVEADCLDRAGAPMKLQATARNPAPPLDPRPVLDVALADGAPPAARFVVEPGRVHVLRAARGDGRPAEGLRLRLRSARAA